MRKDEGINVNYKNIFDSSPEAIMIVDTKGKILDMNNRVKEWLGYNPKTLIGKNIFNK